MPDEDVHQTRVRALTRDLRFSLIELCEATGVETRIVHECVEHGLLEPSGEEPSRWFFPGDAVRRVQIVTRLRRDLDINVAGAALVIEMLDELEDLRRQVSILEKQLEGARLDLD
jgi:chaperone modulatory protein CbpM